MVGESGLLLHGNARGDTPRLAGKDSGWVNNETRNAPQVQFVLDLPQMGVATVFLEVGEEDSW